MGEGKSTPVAGVVQERLLWRAATPDDARVARALHTGRRSTPFMNSARRGCSTGSSTFWT
jgi:hypothetical protein